MIDQSTQIAVANEIAQGTPQNAIAAQLGISQPSVSRINNKHKDLILTLQARYIDEGLPLIVARSLKEITKAHTLTEDQLFDKDNQQALARIDKKEEALLKATGIVPSNAPSIHVQQIFNDNRKTILNPNVANLLHGQLNDIIDGEIIEDEDNE